MSQSFLAYLNPSNAIEEEGASESRTQVVYMTCWEVTPSRHEVGYASWDRAGTVCQNLLVLGNSAGYEPIWGLH